MPQLFQTDAQHEGFKAGQSLEGWGGACPYDHGDPSQRREWFDGFAEGRIFCLVSSADPANTIVRRSPEPSRKTKPLVMMNTAMAIARNEGKYWGQRWDRNQIQCPFDKQLPELQRAWLEGFKEGHDARAIVQP